MAELITVVPQAEPPPLPDVDLTTVLAGVEFPNPVFTASGCAASGSIPVSFCMARRKPASAPHVT